MALVVGILLALFVLGSPWSYLVVAGGVAVEVTEVALGWRWTHRRPPVVGVEALVGATAVVVDPCEPEGRVRVAGELWAARCDAGAATGDRVRIVGIDGLLLRAEPA